MKTLSFSFEEKDKITFGKKQSFFQMKHYSLVYKLLNVINSYTH
jgi:hypothetical protein